MKPSAKIILDSITEQGHRLVTMEVVMHRFVLAEMNTHRAFSRNSASSRAIPFKKIFDRVDNSPALPWYWGKEQKGMQSGEELLATEQMACQGIWEEASKDALSKAWALHTIGVHKSLVNRLLEPFMWHTAIISATEWDNFFWQRCDPDAQPEMKAVADEMQRAYYTSIPKQLVHGQWHMPYIQDRDWDDARQILTGDNTVMVSPTMYELTDMLKKVSVARCARVSYLTHDGERSLETDIGLFEKLSVKLHPSPFEHVAKPIVVPQGYETQGSGSQGWSGNFHGWHQFRKDLPNENRQNFVPNLPDLMREYIIASPHGSARVEVPVGTVPSVTGKVGGGTYTLTSIKGTVARVTRPIKWDTPQDEVKKIMEEYDL